mgnify:CR=1 FL=1
MLRLALERNQKWLGEHEALAGVGYIVLDIPCLAFWIVYIGSGGKHRLYWGGFLDM